MNKLYDLLMEQAYKSMLIEMGASDKVIYRIMRNRILQTLATFIIISLMYFIFDSVWIFVIATVLSGVIYYNGFNQMKNKYILFSFEQELQFSKFARLIGPYLKKNGGNAPLYAIFNKVMPRLKEPMQKELYHLMSEMVANPTEIAPFISFAKRMGDSDFAISFMTSLYDYQHSTNDITVIDELVQIANDALMKNIDVVVQYKLRKYRHIPTLFTASIVVVLLGFFVGMFIDMGSQIGNLSTIDK